MSSSTAFDTFIYASTLKQGGFSDKQVEALTKAQSESIKDLIDDKLATKQDLKLLEVTLKKDIELIRRDVKELEASTKREVEFIRHDMKELEERLIYKLTIRLGGMLTVGIGVIAALMKIL